MYKVYLITNTSNGKYYVGHTSKTLHRRWRNHISYAYTIGHTYLAAAIRKHDPNAFIIESIVESKTLAESLYLERLWIWALNSCDPNIGYNLMFGGQGGLPNAETRAKQSARRKGKPRPYLSTPETNAKASAAMKLAWAEGRAKGRTGIPPSPEAQQSQKQKMTGPGSPNYRDEIPAERIINLRLSGLTLKQVATELNIPMSRVVSRCKASGISFPRVFKHSEETKQKLRKSSTGRKFSPETLALISKKSLDSWNKRKQQNGTC